MHTKDLTFVTGNLRKVEEVKKICGDDFPYNIINVKLDLDEYQGEPDFISTKKCLAASKAIGEPVIVEDTCLCFNALKGLPGPYIKWFLDSLGNDGLVKMLQGFEDKSGYAQCTIAYCAPGEKVELFIGKVDGQIVAPRGETKFGWDPIFQPEGWEKTFAEMDSSEKNQISHRRRAFEEMKKYFMSKKL